MVKYLLNRFRASEERRQDRAATVWQWHVAWRFQDARSEALYSIRETFSLPWLMICDPSEILACLEGGQYELKTPLWEAPIAVVREAEVCARDWFN